MSSLTRPRLISLEGNIGAGKSTFIETLKQKYKDCNQVLFLQEPVDVWESVKQNGKNMLELYYSNPNKYAFAFQIMAHTTRLQLIRKAVDDVITNKPQIKTIIMERSLEADREIFAKMLYHDGVLQHTEYQIYCMMSNNGLQDFSMDGIIWLTTDADECSRRIKMRNRKGEETIPLQYLKTCEIYHKQWLSADLGFVFYISDDIFTKNTNIRIDDVDEYSDEIIPPGEPIHWDNFNHFLGIKLI
jgi:deoxyadenosine/deoxycytidine kinase